MLDPIVTSALSTSKRIRTTNLPALAARRNPLPAELGPTARRLQSWPIGQRIQAVALADRLADLSPFLQPAAAPAVDMPYWVAQQCDRRALLREIVRAAYDHLSEQNTPALRRRELRQWAWQAHNANNPKSWPQWRRGFQQRYGKRVDAHDYTAIPRYDQLHAELAAYFPEFSGQEREYAFWMELLGPLPELISQRDLWQSALSAVADQRGGADDRPAVDGCADDTQLF